MKKTIFDEALEALSAVLVAKVGNGEQDKFPELIDQARDGDPGAQNAVLMLGAELADLKLKLTAIDKVVQQPKRQKEIVRENAKMVLAALNPSKPEPAAKPTVAEPPAKPEPTQQEPAAKPPEKAQNPPAKPAATGGCSSSNKLDLPLPPPAPANESAAKPYVRPTQQSDSQEKEATAQKAPPWEDLLALSGSINNLKTRELRSFPSDMWWKFGKYENPSTTTAEKRTHYYRLTAWVERAKLADAIWYLRRHGDQLPEDQRKLINEASIDDIMKLEHGVALGLKDALEQVQTEETKRRQQVADQQNQPAQPPAPPAPTVTQPAAKPAVTSPLQPAVTQKLAVQRPPAPGQVDPAKLLADAEERDKERDEEIRHLKRRLKKAKKSKSADEPELTNAKKPRQWLGLFWRIAVAVVVVAALAAGGIAVRNYLANVNSGGSTLQSVDSIYNYNGENTGK
ncbi:MAG: hypothetical protein Q8P73_03815 [bacterium]|nr:hypothetical protein [bacterium]